MKILGDRRMLAALLIIPGLLAVLWDYQQSKAKTKREVTDSADTFIPLGYVLVPIEIQNFRALDSILGRFGVVDLFSAPIEPNGKGKKVASGVKILRAPLNPDHFAVLVREEDAPQLVRADGSYFVVVQNPKKGGMHFVNPVRKVSRIQVESP